MNSRAVIIAAATSVLFLSGARHYLLSPKIVGTCDHDGVAVKATKEDYFIADRVKVQIQDYRWKDFNVVLKTQWSFRPIILDGDVLHSFA